jgi:hypothetical protein
VYRCSGPGANARGVYTTEGFTVLAKSAGRRDNVASIANGTHGRFREKLIERGVMTVDGDQVIFPKDHLFSSPSAAAVAVLGRSANGWVEWRLDDGRTLQDVERADIASTPEE